MSFDYVSIDFCVQKETTFRVGHFTTISGYFVGNYIYIFHKTEVMKIILRCLTCLNLNWIKRYHLNYNLFWQLCFLIFGEKNPENLSFKNGHFLTICGHLFGKYIDIFHKTEIQTDILRCLMCKNINWTKSYHKVLLKIFIFSCLKMPHFRANLPKWVLTPQKENSCRIFKMATFSKLFCCYMAHIIR